MYFSIYEEICEYLIWCKLHTLAGRRTRRPLEEFYYQNMRRDIPAEFSLLDVEVVNLQLRILFNYQLVYHISIEDLMNVPNCQINTPIVLLTSIC